MKPTNGSTGRCIWRFSVIAQRKCIRSDGCTRRGWLSGATSRGNGALDRNRRQLPVIVTFVDTDEHVCRVLPNLKEMAAHRLMVREHVILEQGSRASPKPAPL